MKPLLSESKFFCLLLSGLSAVLILAGCHTAEYRFHETAGTNSTPTGSSPGSAASANASTNSGGGLAFSSDRLVPGNKITITYSGNPTPPPKHEEKVREDGYISPPLLGRPVMAAGKTVGQLQEELQAFYVPSQFKSLTIIVSTEERVVYVGGEVKTPGPHIYLPGMTVLKAIQAAGDFTEYGNRRNVVVIHANGQKEKVNCSKAQQDSKYDKPVYPDDRIQVSRRIVW